MSTVAQVQQDLFYYIGNYLVNQGEPFPTSCEKFQYDFDSDGTFLFHKWDFPTVPEPTLSDLVAIPAANVLQHKVLTQIQNSQNGPALIAFGNLILSKLGREDLTITTQDLVPLVLANPQVRILNR